MQKLNKVLEELKDEMNLCHLDQDDIDAVLACGTEVSIGPKEGKLAHGAMFLIRGNTTLTLDEINDWGEKLIGKYCDEDANVIWGARIIEDLPDIEVVQIYVY